MTVQKRRRGHNKTKYMCHTDTSKITEWRCHRICRNDQAPPDFSVTKSPEPYDLVEPPPPVLALPRR